MRPPSGSERGLAASSAGRFVFNAGTAMRSGPLLRAGRRDIQRLGAISRWAPFTDGRAPCGITVSGFERNAYLGAPRGLEKRESARASQLMRLGDVNTPSRPLARGYSAAGAHVTAAPRSIPSARARTGS